MNGEQVGVGTSKPLSRPTPDGCGCHWSYGNLKHVDWHIAWGKFADDAEVLSQPGMAEYEALT